MPSNPSQEDRRGAVALYVTSSEGANLSCIFMGVAPRSVKPMGTWHETLRGTSHLACVIRFGPVTSPYNREWQSQSPVLVKLQLLSPKTVPRHCHDCPIILPAKARRELDIRAALLSDAHSTGSKEHKSAVTKNLLVLDQGSSFECLCVGTPKVGFSRLQLAAVRASSLKMREHGSARPQWT